MAILLVCRLEVRFISTFLIIIPIFIAVGCCCCTTVCGLMCMANIDLGDQGGQQPMDSTLNPAFDAKPSKDDISTPILTGSNAAQDGSTEASKSQSSSTDVNNVEAVKKSDSVDID